MTPARNMIGGEAHGSLRGYSIGFALSIVLTAFAFGLGMTGALPRAITLFGVFAAAVVQILVHLHYFLHMDRSSSQRWNVMSFLFTGLVMGIFIGGSLWIMYDLHYRMMG
jgi:cytochrome o ubiquinol oxidase operon protein cyoD